MKMAAQISRRIAYNWVILMKTPKWNSQFPLVKLRFHFSFSRMMKRALITGVKYMYRTEIK